MSDGGYFGVLPPSLQSYIFIHCRANYFGEHFTSGQLLPASIPQAASMSRPREVRMVLSIPCEFR